MRTLRRVTFCLAGLVALGLPVGTLTATAGQGTPRPPGPEKAPLPPGNDSERKASIKLHKSRGKLTGDKNGNSRADAGDTLTYTYTVTNTGKVRLRKVRVADDKIGRVTCGRTALKPGAKTTCKGTYPVTKDDVRAKKVTNSATARANPPGGRRPVRDGDRVTTPVPPPKPPGDTGPSLRVRKSADRQVASPRRSVTFTIVVKNKGSGAAKDLDLTDDLSGVLENTRGASSDVTADRGDASVDGETLRWTGDLAAGQTARIKYTVQVGRRLKGDKKLVNKVTLAGSNCAAGSSDSACTATVLLAVLKLSKEGRPRSLEPGRTHNYKVTITNSGSYTFTSANPASAEDDMTGALDDAKYNKDAKLTGPGKMSFSSPRLTWSGPLAPGESATITYSLTMNDPSTGDGSAQNVIRSTTKLPGDERRASRLWQRAPAPTCPVTGIEVQCQVSTLIAGHSRSSAHSRS